MFAYRSYDDAIVFNMIGPLAIWDRTMRGIGAADGTQRTDPAVAEHRTKRRHPGRKHLRHQPV
jgi:hypothetical protein